ncbi:helix-turn-helix domain-containing protein [Streptomyces kaempferi]|uniref:Helix-turn-helix domain-containing protein n=1 Tax=Streptomyces kaempferi TaxID=333725 RepID=A0ABW3XU92_9ACTN
MSTTLVDRTPLRGPERDAAKQRAAELYALGAPIRSVAREIGRSYGCTRSLLIQAGVKLRDRGGYQRKPAA